jgi:PAS domain-containing protein
MRESEARAKVAEAVQVERRRLAAVLDLLPAYVVLLSPDYRVPFANRFFEERFGKSEGRRCYEYLFHRTEPCEVCETYKALKTNAPLRWEWTGPDGRHYDIHDFPFADVDGSPLIMEVGLDITERKQAQAELEKHREHLQELVNERTAELRATNEELTRFNEAMVGRELRMIELKQEVNALCAQLGQPPRYGRVAEEQARPAP